MKTWTQYLRYPIQPRYQKLMPSYLDIIITVKVPIRTSKDCKKSLTIYINSFRNLNLTSCQKIYLVQPIILLCLLSTFSHQNTEIWTHPTEKKCKRSAWIKYDRERLGNWEDALKVHNFNSHIKLEHNCNVFQFQNIKKQKWIQHQPKQCSTYRQLQYLVLVPESFEPEKFFMQVSV